MKCLAKQYHRDTFHPLVLFHLHHIGHGHCMRCPCAGRDTQSMMVLYGPEGSLRNCRQKSCPGTFHRLAPESGARRCTAPCLWSLERARKFQSSSLHRHMHCRQLRQDMLCTDLRTLPTVHIHGHSRFRRTGHARDQGVQSLV